MKANQLRIGNWVLYDGRPFKIYGISKEYPFLDTIEFGVGVVEWKDLQPIQLTKEIALELGGKSDLHQVLVFDNELWSIEYDYHFKRLGIERLNGDMFIKEVEHLHQLQNIVFDLTGEELKIELC